MKTIALATDFSENGNQAAHFAYQLAQKQGANLLLVNAYHFWPTNPADSGDDFPLSARAMHDENQHQLEKLAHELRDKHGTGVAVRCEAREGFAVPVLREVTQNHDVELLVMATTGSAPQSAQLMGSVATEMIPQTTVPLLLLPPGAQFSAIDNAVLAIDLDAQTDAVTLEESMRFARLFGCVLNILCIHNKPLDTLASNRAENLRRLLHPVPHTFSIVPGTDVYSMLLNFAHTNKANLIMMLPQEHSWLRNLFVEGETQRVARLTDIPLLAVV